MMKISLKYLFIVSIYILSLVLFSCQKEETIEKIEQDKFVQIYCDVVAYTNMIEPDLRGTFVDSILQYYEVTPEQFQHTVNIYSSDTKKWKKVFEKIVAELERRQEAIKEEKDKPLEQKKQKAEIDAKKKEEEK